MEQGLWRLRQLNLSLPGPSGGQLGLRLRNFGSKFNNSVFSPLLFLESLFFKFPLFFL